MRILFLSLGRFEGLSNGGIYHDLLRKFIEHEHEISVVCPDERRFKSRLKNQNYRNVRIIGVRTLNLQKTNSVEKFISTLMIEFQFIWAIRKYFRNRSIDLVLYATPPITFAKVISYVKARYESKSYLLLKDIFPQNAIDLGMLIDRGPIYNFFRTKERKLYEVSDWIGCMSEANCKYLLNNNTHINASKVEINPNSIKPGDHLISNEKRTEIREGYGIPEDKTIFIYGGNLGKPQGISFLVDVLQSFIGNPNVFFIIAGSGTEFWRIHSWYIQNSPDNTLLLNRLPVSEFRDLLRACDVGMIFLDRRFTIPNFPSRLLDYLEASLPVISATDTNTDIGSTMIKNGFGLWSESGDLKAITSNIMRLTDADTRDKLGKKGRQFLLDNYTVDISYSKIMRHFS